MHKLNTIEKLYNGFCSTKLLWKDHLYGLKQFEYSKLEQLSFERSTHKKLRLGQLAEQFVFNQLEQTKHCKILAENIQIQKDKHTLGELDALIELENNRIHLEMVYKFYLYDESLGDTEKERWIGPNRKDSLIEKITKLKKKQFPLLYTSECKSALEQLHLNSEDFQQQVLFKAQLFVPYNTTVMFKRLNQDCVCGFYIKTQHLEDFKDCMFFLPIKLDWLIDANHSVKWMNMESFKIHAEEFLRQKRSPLIWIKNPNHTLIKCFLVWW